ncbi:MAG: hypothetical protein RL150_521 [Candidatus Parcubacteria bacterium]|jgi:hypothetical protein
MEPQATQKKMSLIWALIVLIIIAGIVFLAFRPAQQADAPTVTDTMIATSTDAAATTTPAAPAAAPQQGAPAVSGSTGASTAGIPTTPQVIQGDGYIATVTPVTGEAPRIDLFALEQAAPGEACFIKWEVEKAATCEIRNVTSKTSVRSVPDEGTLQTLEVGTYQLVCKGTGGKTTTSTEVACK